MRYAVLSDVHSNLEALDAAFAQIRDDDAVLCLGDIVGYGPNPNECVERMRTRATATVLGNHDVAAIDDFGLTYFNPAAREAMKWTQGVLLPENRAWLDQLGYEFRMPEFLLVHGAPVNYFEYILDKPGAARAFASTDAPIIFIGHTHIAEVYALQPDGRIEHQHLQQGGEVRLLDGVRYLINVGSLGQPRDLNPRASFGFFDTVERTVRIERIEYPIAQVQEKIATAGLPDALARRLLVGR
ncbi:metallophosphoesterase [Vulcanimicrobium alpinum]|uniref:Metallophosphoesterase n=1 Tax=Vulcanimicrobium alpinum TaxID=3016050 RepID=A0AAN1XXA1_UNVUL|nr:metallophosphoesterase family protein [Vulcanimicrobium alpinum]BDE07100.1 metallophosphoesterase [Vulcanimicrobium alpinum]